MIALNNLSFEFGGRLLYDDVNWHIGEHDRIALIGRNGAGKSTLLRVIYGEYQPASGNISKPKDLTIGFLNQDMLSREYEGSIFDVAMTAFKRQLELEKIIDELLIQAETDHSDELMHKLAESQHEYLMLDGYNLHHQCSKVLEGLGFETDQINKPFMQFSGGWRMRVLLARLLLQNPDVLMLDEPTNHLDLPAIEWLEDYLHDYPGSVIIVSHDREFLDRVTTTTVEIANRKITEYPGNYSFYMEARSERAELQQRAFDNQQQFIKNQERLINRFKAKASKANMAQSRIKMLDRIEKVEAPESDEANINIIFRVSRQPGRILSELRDVSKSFGDLHLLEHSSRNIEKGDKIALVGANGKGKSTLLRMIAGSEKYEGTIIPGYNIDMTFYAQHQLESLHLENDILSELQQLASDRSESELRNILGCFLFAGDDVFKKIKILSGGEKARVALAKTLVAEANFMLLDEPTNHLDIQSISILTKALQEYPGTFITVSHDRYFVEKIANKIWWIENLELKEFPGTFNEWEAYMAKRKREAEKEAKQKNEKEKEQTKSSVKAEIKTAEEISTSTKSANNNDVNAKQKLSNNQIQKLKNTLADCEKEIELLRKQLEEMESQFSLPEFSNDFGKLSQLQAAYDAGKEKMEEANKRFEETFTSLDELGAL